MAIFKVNVPIETTEPKIEVTVGPDSSLPKGRVRFQLVVVDDSGNESSPDTVDVIIQDTQRPTAVLDAPRAVEFGNSFTLLGDRSLDIGGRIVTYRWTLIEARERPRGGESPPIIVQPPDR
jgi:hypothetical protein